MKLETIGIGAVGRARIGASPLLLLQELRERAVKVWRKLCRYSQHKPRQLRLCENLPLGDRRFVAVVEYEHFRFLLGGTSTSLVMLAPLGECSSPSQTGGTNAAAGHLPQGVPKGIKL